MTHNFSLFSCFQIYIMFASVTEKNDIYVENYWICPYPCTKEVLTNLYSL